jgi:hypothetical protein
MMRCKNRCVVSAAFTSCSCYAVAPDGETVEGEREGMEGGKMQDARQDLTTPHS